MKELKDTLWKAADKLRGSLEASDYKDVILGLVFLKYVSDSFEERRAQIRAELEADGGYVEGDIDESLEDKDEYSGAGVFWVPVNARWQFLAERAKGTETKTIGELINEAMGWLMEANPPLNGTLPRIYNREGVDQRRLGELLDLFNSARFTGEGASKARDLLGEVYEYFLGKFAAAEGKRGGEFYTPPSVVRVLVEVMEPSAGRIYDPCCGSGGMFVQAEKFLEAHHRNPAELSVYGQENMERTWRMAKMNLAIHGLIGNLGPSWGDTFARDLHPDLQADYVLANPPFNIKDWARNEDDARWRYGVPPAGNANYAWLQHIVSKLGPKGQAGVVLANGSMNTNSGGEGQIRANLVEADLVSVMVALPTQLFRSTGIPVCLWFFAKDKKWTADRRGQVLFVNAQNLGYMVDRAERALSEEDIAKIADTYRAWRGEPQLPEPVEVPSQLAELVEASVDPSTSSGVYADIPGFCYSATLAEIKDAEYALTPGRYVGTAEIADDGEPIDDKVKRLTEELLAALDESARLDAVVREQLGRLA
ncbi:MAG: type I restriction-modification system subunit M [Actinobacteria bacterium]|nr:type I restriction-modification system subunit M [Actinomycetota bacterium]MBU3985306.1 type I restriction-modification system subunit M [Actinomycetota bacterium]MBU4008296.1 type I restriction-modification system subunit M [Actinomycetota bacterium]MBU4064490.1 type I restriction-modification system subunit M [Actinomycetota bacterium]MBU4094002.1 type I restriction-modification system subunit M [Actinomycetota bacterium]